MNFVSTGLLQLRNNVTNSYD